MNESSRDFKSASSLITSDSANEKKDCHPACGCRCLWGIPLPCSCGYGLLPPFYSPSLWVTNLFTHLRRTLRLRHRLDVWNRRRDDRPWTRISHIRRIRHRMRDEFLLWNLWLCRYTPDRTHPFRRSGDSGSLNAHSLDNVMKDVGRLGQGSRLSTEKGHSSPTPPENSQPDDLLHPLTGKRIKAVLRNGLGLVGRLVAVNEFEALLELDTGGRLVVMKHAIEYVEPVEEAEV